MVYSICLPARSSEAAGCSLKPPAFLDVLGQCVSSHHSWLGVAPVWTCFPPPSVPVIPSSWSLQSSWEQQVIGKAVCVLEFVYVTFCVCVSLCVAKT